MNPCVAREYIESCLKIRTKSGAVVPFRLNAAQQKLYAVAKRQQDEGKPVRIIILKARQLGFSTLTEALLFHACATRSNVNALVVAHREDATANLFRMSKLFYDELPAPVKPMLRTSNAQELVFENPSRASRGALPGLRSRFRCATAGGRGIGRSDTLQCVHLSEYAFWPEGGESKAATLAGILQAVPSRPGTMVIIESTANGCEDFKDRWDAAVAESTMVENAVAMRDAGCTLDETVTWLEAEKSTNQIFFTVGDLDYLIKGGRIGKVTGRAANMLGLKPMILFKEGEIFSGGVARGRQKSFEKALEQLMNYLDAHGGTPDDYRITVGYGYDADEGRRLWMQTRAALRAKYPGAQCEVGLLQIGCTIAVHTGPYALGMGVMRRWKKQN